jgi:hypothetical protein
MKFLVDNQLPLKLAGYLRSRGHAASHVFDLSLDEADTVKSGRGAQPKDIFSSAKMRTLFFSLFALTTVVAWYGFTLVIAATSL